MKVDLFDFDLPEERIATRPITPRDAARLLCVGGGNSPAFTDNTIADLPGLLKSGDLLVLNNTKVIPARLLGRRGEAKVEVTLHKQLGARASANMEQDTPQHAIHWQAFAKPAKKLRVGDVFTIAEDFTATATAKLESGEVVLEFAESEPSFLHKLQQHGAMPLPPYMKRAADAQDASHYQTIFAKAEGAVAAPTAGLHFTPRLMAALAENGMETVEVTLHVGAGTFLRVKVDDTEYHQMHSEWIEVTQQQADVINRARAEGRRIVAVGTTALRTLESICDEAGTAHAFAGETDIFITPGYRFRLVDVLLTNFHLPRSTLFMLVSAFAGLQTMQAAYQHAIDNAYRFYSYGDACLLFRNDAA